MRPALHASVEILRVLKARTAHKYLSIRSFPISAMEANLHNNQLFARKFPYFGSKLQQ